MPVHVPVHVPVPVPVHVHVHVCMPCGRAHDVIPINELYR